MGRVEAIGGDDASTRQDQFVLRVADPMRACRGDDTSVLEDEVAQKVAARASARQDSMLEDEVAQGVVAARDSDNDNNDVSACPVSPSRYQDGTDADTARLRRNDHYAGETSHDGALVSGREEHHDNSGETSDNGAESSAGCQDFCHRPLDLSFEKPSRQNNQPKTLESPSSLAASLSMLPTPFHTFQYYSPMINVPKVLQKW